MQNHRSISVRRSFSLFVAILALVITQVGFIFTPVFAQDEVPTPQETTQPTPTSTETLPTEAVEPTEPPLDDQVIPPTPVMTDEEAIQAALDDSLNQMREMSLAYLLYDVEIDHLEFAEDGSLALVWLAFHDPQTGENIATEPGLALARRAEDGQAWGITLQVDPAWTETLALVPEAMLSAENKAELLAPEPDEASAQATTPIGGYKLPWKGGTYNYISGSIGHVLTYKSCPTTCMYAFDFADGTMFPIHAARSGVVKYFYDSAANGNTSTTNYIVLEDASTTPTTYQVYYHLAQGTIPAGLRVVGAPVSQGQYIGNADDTGASTGHHLHFHVHTNPNAVWSTSIDITFDDVGENGGRPRTCAEAAAYPSYGTQCAPGNKLLSGNSSGAAPAAPAITGPSGTLKTSKPALTWNAVPNANQYSLWINKVGQTSAALSVSVNADVCSGNMCSYTPTTALADASYEFKARAGTDAGWSAWSTPTSFTLNTVPTVPELVSPGGQISINNPAYTWKVVPGASRYYLMVYAEKSSSYVIYRTLTADAVCGAETCAYTSTLKLGHGNYKFKVRAGNATVWSAYSAFMTFNAYLAPVPPTLTEPAADTKITIQRPTYRWQAVPGATKYQIHVYSLTKKATVGTYAATSTYLCTGDVCSYKPATNLASGKYQVRIRAYNSYGYGDYSAYTPFTVQLVPDPPATVSPSGTISTLSPAYTWKAVPGVTSYYLMVWSYAENTYIIYRTLYPANVCSGDTCAYTSTANVVKGRAYGFKVRASNSFGVGVFSPYMDFTVAQ